MISQIHFLYKSILCEVRICKNDNMLVCKGCVNSQLFHASWIVITFASVSLFAKDMSNYPVRLNNSANANQI